MGGCKYVYEHLQLEGPLASDGAKWRVDQAVRCPSQGNMSKREYSSHGETWTWPGPTRKKTFQKGKIMNTFHVRVTHHPEG